MPEITALPRQFSSSSQAQTGCRRARQQALRFGQLDLQRFAGEGEQGIGVTHRGLLPEGY
ncbi:hypothetical protein J4732_15645 [Serratia marcescens]|uniref:Uncharacterized protein n=1 Tax=Serratia marcescens TaxID=615 RepID=A0A939NT74_SERMA|nr:hypothetical protein [Serratia marcescens]